MDGSLCLFLRFFVSFIVCLLFLGLFIKSVKSKIYAVVPLLFFHHLIFCFSIVKNEVGWTRTSIYKHLSTLLMVCLSFYQLNYNPNRKKNNLKIHYILKLQQSHENIHWMIWGMNCLFSFVLFCFSSLFVCLFIFNKKWRWWASIPLPLPC